MLVANEACVVAITRWVVGSDRGLLHKVLYGLLKAQYAGYDVVRQVSRFTAGAF